MKFFVALYFLFFITDAFSQETQPNFENDSSTYINFWMVDPYASDSATNAANWIIISNMSEDFINAYEDSLKAIEDARIGAIDSTQSLTTLFGLEIDTSQSNFFQILSPLVDTLVSIIFSQAYSPCNFYENQSITSENGIEIEYTCWKGILTGTDENGKVKWETELNKFTDSYISTMRPTGEDKFDVVIVLIDKSRYLVNSKNGRVKKIS